MSSMIAAFSITPLGTDESVGDLVTEAVRIVRASGLPNETNAMFINIEGEWDEVMRVIKQCVDRIFRDLIRIIFVDHHTFYEHVLKGFVIPNTTIVLRDAKSARHTSQWCE